MMPDFLTIRLDPAKIKNRWQLGALGLVVWLVIGILILTQPNVRLDIALAVLIPTILVLPIILMISRATPDDSRVVGPHSPSPSAQEEAAMVAEVILARQFCSTLQFMMPRNASCPC